MADLLTAFLGIVTALATVAGVLVAVYFSIRNRQDARLKLEADAQAARRRQAAELHLRYGNDNVDGAMRVIGDFRDEWLAAAAGRSYYDVFKEGRPLHIEEARARLRTFWDWVTELYESNAIPKEVLASTSEWLARGNNYRMLVEPIDIANWYSPKGADFYGTSGKHYLRRTRDKAVVRPRRYYVLEQAYREAYLDRSEISIGNAVNELVAAGVLDANQVNDNLRGELHKLSNDR